MHATRIARKRGAARLQLFAASAALLFAAGVASADESIYPAESVTRTRADLAGKVTAEERPFAFLVDPSTPSAGVFAVGYTLGMGSGISADRPIPVVMQNQGVSNEVSVGYGVTSWFEPYLSANIVADTSSNTTYLNGIAGLKFQLTNPDSPWRVALLGGALREGASADWGAWFRATGSFSAGPLLIEANAYIEHIFAPDRDALDYIGALGASYRIIPGLRVGAEYVGQDLEEMFTSGVEGGARMGLGPNIAVDLDHNRYQITVAALFGLNAVSPTAIVRAGLLASF